MSASSARRAAGRSPRGAGSVTAPRRELRSMPAPARSVRPLAKPGRMPSAGGYAQLRANPLSTLRVESTQRRMQRDDHPHLAAQAAARKLARSEASTSEHGAEQQVWGWWARAEAKPSTRPALRRSTPTPPGHHKEEKAPAGGGGHAHGGGMGGDF